MKKYIVRLCTALFFVAPLSANDDKYILDTLLKYNYGIIKMGQSGETEFFKEFVKDDVATKLQVWYESWKFSNLTLIANINDMKFGPIAYNENNATIRTMENWTFSYVNLVTKEWAMNPETMFYTMHYTLQKQGDKWMITDIKRLNEELFVTPDTNTPSLKENNKKPTEDFVLPETKQNTPTH